MMLPSADTPLYNHPLPDIEQWPKDQGCEQDSQELHCWHINRPAWKAELWLDVEELTVRYFKIAEGDPQWERFANRDIVRSFKYSLSRQDIEEAVFGGP